MSIDQFLLKQLFSETQYRRGAFSDHCILVEETNISYDGKEIRVRRSNNDLTVLFLEFNVHTFWWRMRSPSKIFPQDIFQGVFKLLFKDLTTTKMLSPWVIFWNNSAVRISCSHRLFSFFFQSNYQFKTNPLRMTQPELQFETYIMLYHCTSLCSKKYRRLLSRCLQHALDQAPVTVCLLKRRSLGSDIQDRERDEYSQHSKNCFSLSNTAFRKPWKRRRWREGEIKFNLFDISSVESFMIASSVLPRSRYINKRITFLRVCMLRMRVYSRHICFSAQEYK